jgi:hypothetical protein
MQQLACPDYFSTAWNPQGEAMPASPMIAKIMQGEAELGRHLYIPPNRVAIGQDVRYCGKPYRVAAEEIKGGVYEIQLSRGSK